MKYSISVALLVFAALVSIVGGYSDNVLIGLLLSAGLFSISESVKSNQNENSDID